MSSLSLDAVESELLTNQGWLMTKTSDGPEFSMDLGDRKITMGPVIHRKLTPMSFRTQARRYDRVYSEIARAVGWGGDKFLPGDNMSEAMSKFEIERFDASFSKKITEILKNYALEDNPTTLIYESIERRKQARRSLTIADLIDYAYLGRSEELEKISLEGTSDDNEYLAAGEDPEYLEKAIEIARGNASTFNVSSI
jgi:hypothetical protein